MTQTLRSDYTRLRPIRFPAYAGRQFYMHSFEARDPCMPEGFEDYLKPVQQLLQAARIDDRKVHVTIDEKIVQPGMSQRRPGPHVDGYFTSGIWSHDNPGPGSWNHNCNRIPGRMAIIVASTVPGCRAWRGVFHGDPQNDGDCSHFVHGTGKVLPANAGYLLTPDCIHESMRFEIRVQRQFLRIAFAL